MPLECEDVEPYRSISVSQTDMDQGTSGSNINDQNLEAYLARLLEAICNDLKDLEQDIEELHDSQ